MVDNSQLLKTGTVLHNTYRIDSYLASGGFGNTYLVTHLQLNEHMVVKEFFLKGVNLRGEDTTTVRVGVTENNPLFKSQREKFKKEAQRIRKLNNDHVVKVHDLFEENDTVYYVMDYIEGSSLKSLMQQLGGAFSENVVEKVLLEILDALDAVHGANLWHMDIKPDNIMIDKTGRCVLIDFGSSKQMTVEETNQTSTAMTYTPDYAPMEQVFGTREKWGPWTDFYALGATLYNLLTTKTPPISSDIASDGDTAFSYPDRVSNKFRQLIRFLMQPLTKDRPQTTDAIRDFLNQPDEQTIINPLSPQTNNEETILEAEKTLIKKKTQQENSREKKVQNPSLKKSRMKNILLVATIFVFLVTTVVFLVLYLDARRTIRNLDQGERNMAEQKEKEVPAAEENYWEAEEAAAEAEAPAAEAEYWAEEAAAEEVAAEEVAAEEVAAAEEYWPAETK